MTDIECPREQEVVEAVSSGRWLRDGELAAHAASCAICDDLVAVAGAIGEERERACADAHIPAAGLVWWRAQLRARHQVAETAGRPITCIQGVAGAVAAGLFFTLGGLLWPWLRASFDWVDAVSRTAETGRLWMPLALGVGAWLVLAPVLMLLVLSDD